MQIPIQKLIIYRHLASDILIQKYLTHQQKSIDSEALYELIHDLVLQNTTLPHHLLTLLVKTENPFTIRMENPEYVLTELDYACLMNDLNILQSLFRSMLKFTTVHQSYKPFMSLFQVNSTNHPVLEPYFLYFQTCASPIQQVGCDAFVSLCRQSGLGDFAFHTAFLYRNSHEFMPITAFHPLDWDKIYGYTYQKEQLYKNTLALVSGAPFHNALLVGSSGTGKSSSIKAMVSMFAAKKLRLIQMQKGQLHLLPKVMAHISERAFKFIIFIDDLSFEANEDEYKFLKSFIEGGVMGKSDHVAFYITSNRRHLIKEIRSERDNDIHMNDFIQEMTSLSDRFGLTLFYEAPEQKVYLDMVKKMLSSNGMEMDDELLRNHARQWSLEHGGMSGRTAEQFVKHVLMQNHLEQQK